MNTAAGAWLRTAGAAGVCKSLWLSYAFAGPAGDAPARPPQGRSVWVLTAQLCRARSPGPEPLGIPGASAPQPEDTVPPPSPPLRHSLQAAWAALLEMSPARRALQGRQPGMPPALSPPHSSLSRATRSPAGSAGAPAIWDTRAIVLDPRRCRL